jgi:hypothetical protein
MGWGVGLRQVRAQLMKFYFGDARVKPRSPEPTRHPQIKIVNLLGLSENVNHAPNRLRTRHVHECFKLEFVD